MNGGGHVLNLESICMYVCVYVCPCICIVSACTRNNNYITYNNLFIPFIIINLLFLFILFLVVGLLLLFIII